MRRALLLFLLLGNAAVAVFVMKPWAANANPIHGGWCAQEERMFIDAAGIGFNEHTLCTTETPVTLDGADTWEGAATCANIYVTAINDDGTVETHEMPLPEIDRITLHLTGADDLNVILGEEGRVIPYARCDF